MRVVKEAAIRKNEILDAAEHLFVTKGFDKTSTNDILSEVGIARGTLYYHFKSKEEILDAMIMRFTQERLKKAAQIASEQDKPVLLRMTQMILAINANSAIGEELLEQVHRPQNALMHQKMQESVLAGVTPLCAKLIEEGIEQGLCHNNYPYEAAEMTLIYAMNAFDTLADDENRARKIAAFIYHTERILGMPQGSMQEALIPLFEQ